MSYALEVLKKPSQRDKQVKVGASNISNPCDRCLADDLIGVERKQGPYWLGARIGTAIHRALEEDAPDNVQTELRVTLGEIPGYGTVESTLDLYEPDTKTVRDHKTTTRDKLKRIKRALDGGNADEGTVFKVVTYITQAMLYGWALKKTGAEVERVGLEFICRDGTGDNDIFSWETDYDEETAVEAWERAVEIYAKVGAGEDLNQFEWHPSCYYCSVLR